MKTTIIIIAILLAGCANTAYDRKVDQIEAREAYAIGKSACQSRGGTVLIRTNRGSRLGEPDYRKALCTSR